MRFLKVALLLASLLWLAGLSFAQGGGAGSSSPSAKAEVVKPGNSGTNGDTDVNNDANSQGNASITPKGEWPDSTSTEVKTKSGFKGTIGGIETGDAANLGPNNTATVYTNGGNVSVGGGSTVTIDNTNGTASVTATLPSGATVTVPGGSMAIINT